MTPANFKQELLNKLYRPYTNCTKCPLGSLGRTHIVFGQGNPDANLILIGEGPGREEDLQGKPFVGRSGQLLDRILALINLNRADIYITNIVKCRPPQNRRPTHEESSICRNLLLVNQIKIIQPSVICTLGAAATQGLLEKELQITKIRGSRYSYNSTTVIPTLHPAYILRNPKSLKNLVEDLTLAKNICNEK